MTPGPSESRSSNRLSARGADAGKGRAAEGAADAATSVAYVAADVVRFESIDSTSAHARRLVEYRAGPLRTTVFAARTQTAGVGRQGRAWASPAGGVWFTLHLRIVEPDGAALGSLGASIGAACLGAVGETLRGHGVDAGRAALKLPNDVLIDGKKVLGVLTEVLHEGGLTVALVGVGVNANFPVSALPEELRAKSATLRDVIGRDVDTELLERRLVDALIAEVARVERPRGGEGDGASARGG